MDYSRFVIENYRGIVGPMEIDVRSKSLIPVIGINECGKTTILHAILAFDQFADDMNKGGRHLQDIHNLFRSSPLPPIVSAEITVSRYELKDAIEAAVEDDEAFAIHKGRRYWDRLGTTLYVTRNLETRQYSIKGFNVEKEFQNAIALELLVKLPFLLYFDEFQDSIQDKVEIPESAENATDWARTLQTLFTSTDSSFSIYTLGKKEERQRKSILSKVNRNLNRTLTKEWQNFHLDDIDALELRLDYLEETTDGTQRRYLKFDVIEKDANGDEHFFFIANRSKGFFWFFNFVMKLEFNPKRIFSSKVGAIYILDEPGSYLHSLAQEKLCKKLRAISEKQAVIYCTHSHHLLDPNIIPFTHISVAEKDGTGAIHLKRISDFNGKISRKTSAFQPLFDALQTPPFLAHADGAQVTLIVEGIIDYFLFVLLAPRYVRVLPAVGADSLKYFVSLMIAWGLDYRAIWDNDQEGQASCEEAKRFFRPSSEKNPFFTLPSARGRKRIVQDLVAGADLKMIRNELKLPDNTSFDKTMAGLFYSPQRSTIVSSFSDSTKKAFEEVFSLIGLHAQPPS